MIIIFVDLSNDFRILLLDLLLNAIIMSTLLARLLIILVVFMILFLLRHFIKRLIFILILLIVAFFIYGLFSPSGAAKVWYGVKTFPQQVASWFGGEDVLPYFEYQTLMPETEVSGGQQDVLPMKTSETLEISGSSDSSGTSGTGKSLLPSMKRFMRMDKHHYRSSVLRNLSSLLEQEPLLTGDGWSGDSSSVDDEAIIIPSVSSDNEVLSQELKIIPTPPKSQQSDSQLSQQDIRDAEELF